MISRVPTGLRVETPLVGALLVALLFFVGCNFGGGGGIGTTQVDSTVYTNTPAGSPIEYGYRPDYSLLIGYIWTLERDAKVLHPASERGLRFSPDQNAPYGGEVFLGNGPDLLAYRDGDHVIVAGEIKTGPKEMWMGKTPRYEVRNIKADPLPRSSSNPGPNDGSFVR